MRVYELAGSRRLALFDVPIPEIGPTEILVRTRRSAISVGTEVWRFVNNGHYGGEGGRCGYNSVGEIVAVGTDVPEFRVGDLVFATEPHAEYFAVRHDRAVKIPPGIDPDAAAFTYLPTLGLHGLRSAQYTAGEHVLVVGLGIVGVLAAQIANAVGARVASLEVDPIRRELAQRAAIGPVLNPYDQTTARELHDYFLGIGPDIVIETSQAWSGLLTSIEVARTSTRFAIVGIYRTDPPPDVAQKLARLTFMNRDHFHNQRLTFVGCSNDPVDNYPPGVVRWTIRRNMEYSADCIARGRIDPLSVVTHRYRWDQLESVYERFSAGDCGMVGVVLDWD